MTTNQKLRQEILEQILQYSKGALGPLSTEETLKAASKYFDWIMGGGKA